MPVVYDQYQAPFGPIFVICDERGLAKVAITPESWQDSLAEFPGMVRDAAACAAVIQQLDEYFHGNRRVFNLALSTRGPAFSRRVWEELQRIPFGQTRSYAQIAQILDKPGSCRAVGQANRRNPLPIVIPCHRVVGSNGTLTGYAGKGYLHIKEFLLKLERDSLEAGERQVETEL